MLFLIEGLLEEAHYMRDSRPKPEKVIRIVEADTDEEAQKKFVEHFESQSISYCVNYYASVVECNEVIR